MRVSFDTGKNERFWIVRCALSTISYLSVAILASLLGYVVAIQPRHFSCFEMGILSIQYWPFIRAGAVCSVFWIAFAWRLKWKIAWRKISLASIATAIIIIVVCWNVLSEDYAKRLVINHCERGTVECTIYRERSMDDRSVEQMRADLNSRHCLIHPWGRGERRPLLNNSTRNSLSRDP